MRARRVVVLALAAALVVNALLVVDALTAGLLVPRVEARAPVAAPVAAPARAVPPRVLAADEEAGAAQAEAAYRALVADLRQQKQALDRAAAALAEREQRLARAEQELVARAAAPAARPAFDRLVRAYEAMDPDRAAAALVALRARERQATIEVVLAMKPREAAAVLDALAATSPSLAAELSLEAWRRER
ncbi:MAG: hypothetical protein MUC67_05435 [Acidobacteria bacterium]|nr:hypothetical protein [Acidobacteriota bacterium]